MTRRPDIAGCWRAALSLALCVMLALWPASGALAAGGGRELVAAAAEAGGQLRVGAMFKTVSDEGTTMTFKVTGEGTVGVGAMFEDETTIRHAIDFASGYNGHVTIPGQVEHDGEVYDVTSVLKYAFGSIPFNGGLTGSDVSSVSIPASVEEICQGAFEGMEYLSAVEFEEGSTLRSIGESAFAYTPALKSVSLPASLASMEQRTFWRSGVSDVTFEGTRVTSLPARAFSESSVASLDFVPDSVTSYGDYCFSGCARMEEAAVSPAVASLGEGVFSDCKRLSRAVLPEGTRVTAIPASAFSSCQALESFDFPASVRTVGDYAFQQTGLKAVVVPTTLTYFGRSAFRGCKELESVDFARGHALMLVESGTFSECKALGSVELPPTVTDIGSQAFYGCTSLTSFTMPKRLQTIGSFAFAGCTSLARLTFAGDATWLDSSTSAFYGSASISQVAFLGKKPESLVIVSALPAYYYAVSYYYSEASARAADEGGLAGRLVVKEGAVPSQASGGDVLEGFYRARTSAGKPWVCESGFFQTHAIEDSFYAYSGGTADDLGVGATFTADTVELAEVTYTVTKAAEGGNPGTCAAGFAGGLGTAIAASTTGAITLPERVVGPDSNVYEVAAIEPYAFSGCSRIVSVTIPATVKSIGAGAFSRCTMLRNVYFESDASLLVDAGIFAGCGQIRRVVFGGKKANVSFGTSDPDVYYTVRYYASVSDLRAGRVKSSVVVRERALLGSLGAGDVLSGTVPSLKPPFEWVYESGFSASSALADSTSVYADGGGFQADVTVTSGNVSKTPCWFKVLSLDEATGRGTACVGLCKDGVTAVSTGVSGTVHVPASVADGDGNVYGVVEVGDFAFGSGLEVNYQVGACSQLASVALPDTVTSFGVDAFRGCARLSSIEVPALVRTMGEGVFQGCSLLGRVTFAPGSCLEAVPAHAFANIGQFGLRSIALPASVTGIGADAFAGDWLESIEIPPNVGSIGANAYGNCYQAKELRFLGDAARVAYGSGCFDFSKEWSSLERVVFMGKKSQVALDRIVSKTRRSSIDDSVSLPVYTVYYNVAFYASTADFEAGKQAGNVVVEAGTALARLTAKATLEGSVVSLGKGSVWRVEDGFGFDKRTVDSYYAVAGRDLSAASVVFTPGDFFYTGAYLSPEPVVTWVDGSRLREGVDYEPDPAVGLYHDGYANNRRGPTASLHLRGIGAYAGQAVGTFSISLQVDSSDSFKVSLAESEFEYDGGEKRPGVRVDATVMGAAYDVEPGVDYTVEYADNVNAGTARAIVRGKGMFGGKYERTFSIAPADLRDCDVTLPSGWEDVAAAGGAPAFTLVDAYGNVLVEGRDYSMTVERDGSSGTVYLEGMGNYAGLVSRSYEVPERGEPDGNPGTGPEPGPGPGPGPGTGKGTGSGSGSGAGSGAGSGTGSGSVAGHARGSGTAAVSARAAAYVPDSGTAGVVPSPGLEAAESQEGGGGSESEFRLFSMSDAADMLSEGLEAVREGSWLPAALVALVALAVGIARRSRQFTQALGRGGERETTVIGMKGRKWMV